jgi:hypothetical protein
VIGNERNSREHGQLSLHGVAQNCPASLIGPMLVRSFAARLRAGLAAAPFLPRVAILALRSAGEESDILASRWRDSSGCFRIDLVSLRAKLVCLWCSLELQVGFL